MSSSSATRTDSGRVSSTVSNSTQKGKICSFLASILVVIVGFGLIGVTIYNFITSIIAVITISQQEVEDVCPNSQIWWYVLFIGVIWPVMATKGANDKATSEEPLTSGMVLCIAITYIGLFTTFIIWAWDQLWGVPGFANDTCAMNHWEIYNSTEGANNDGHKLFSVVKWWMYLFMFIDIMIVMILCGLPVLVIFEDCMASKKTNDANDIYGKNLKDILNGIPSHDTQEMEQREKRPDASAQEKEKRTQSTVGKKDTEKAKLPDTVSSSSNYGSNDNVV